MPAENTTETRESACRIGISLHWISTVAGAG